MPWDSLNPQWMKVYDRFFLSASHADLTAEDFGVMGYCMMLANKHGRRDNGSGWVITAAGDPVDALHIARKLNVPDSSAVERTLRRLCAVGTLRRLPSGVYEFPKLKKWQEDPSAERKRRSRELTPNSETPSQRNNRSGKRDSHAECHGDSHVTVTEPFTHRSKKVEVRSKKIRGEKEEERKPEDPVAVAPGSSPAAEPPHVEPTTSGTQALLLKASPGPGDEHVFVFPATGRGPGATWPLTRKNLDELIRAYPDLDVEAEMRKALAKINTGAVSKRSPRGYPRFIANWLDRSVDNPRGGARPNNRATTGPTGAARPTELIRSPTGEHNKRAFDQFEEMYRGGNDDA